MEIRAPTTKSPGRRKEEGMTFVVRITTASTPPVALATALNPPARIIAGRAARGAAIW